MEGRDFCPRCAIKHLAQARALMLEVRKGYPHHIWYAIGHMAEAEDEIQEFMPEVVEKIREARKAMESPPDFKTPDFKTLMYLVGTTALLEETQEPLSETDRN